ncbi:hypothetical protein AQUCO_01900199v1 [Aquilegia coerulea]|uniref:SOSEKI DIX-like domain-containing protein n=2 Tax=Aquilegia coerulea TaxID=218851 RepID=A0A2G5DJF4_AQUCA|nr:hypothetical protein AQUCO_01900199v1 [Aquilegia coerulea]
MEARMRKCRQTSPDRAKVWVEPSKINQSKRVPVVYYLCRNRHLEHPHFIEVPLSSPEGLYLRDVISRLNALRGRGMPSMYSWSCKRSYKNGFVWHDLCEDDLILPAHGSEYVLKGSEIFEESHSDHLRPTSSNMKMQNPKQLQEPTSSRSHEASSPFSSLGKATRPSQQDEVSPPLERPKSSSVSPDYRAVNNPSWASSTSLTNYSICKGDGADASTQTDECVRAAKARETCTRGVSTDDGSLELECSSHHQIQVQRIKENSELCTDEVSPPPSSSSTSSGGKTETLESLIRADVNKMNSFRILEEEDIRMDPNIKLKPSNVLMQLISCGSISVKDHSFGLIPTYRPRFSHSKFPSPLYSTSVMMGEFDCLSENPRMMGLRFEDKEYFSGSLIETKTNKGEGEGFSTLKRSSSYNADRTCKTSDLAEDKEPVDSARSKCIPRSIRASLCKHPRSESLRSPLSERPRKSSSGVDGSDSTSLSVSNASSKRFTEPSSSKKPSQRLDSFREDKNKACFWSSGYNTIKGP